MLHLYYSPLRARPDTYFSIIDFNGNVGEFASPGIGTCGDAAPLDAGRELLANFMVLWSLCAIATFDSCQQGPNATWTSSIGRSFRKDFVLCSADLKMGLSSSLIDQTIDLLQKKMAIVSAFCKAALSGHELLQGLVRRFVYSQGVT